MLESRVIDLSMKMHMETPLEAQQRPYRNFLPGTPANSEGRKSFLFGNQKKRLSKSVEEAVESSNRKISAFEERKQSWSCARMS